jgi:hypothetical protein
MSDKSLLKVIKRAERLNPRCQVPIDLALDTCKLQTSTFKIMSDYQKVVGFIEGKGA